MLQFPWPFLILNWRITGLIKEQILVYNNTATIAPFETRRAQPIFDVKLKSWKHKIFNIFHSFFLRVRWFFGIIKFPFVNIQC